MSQFSDVLERLLATIESRRGADPASSWTAKLLDGGPPLIGKKLAEEAVEAVIAAMQGNREAVAAESADLIYHWLVLLASSGVSLDDVAARLKAREGTSGLAEKASRPT